MQLMHVFSEDEEVELLAQMGGMGKRLELALPRRSWSGADSFQVLQGWSGDGSEESRLIQKGEDFAARGHGGGCGKRKINMGGDVRAADGVEGVFVSPVVTIAAQGAIDPVRGIVVPRRVAVVRKKEISLLQPADGKTQVGGHGGSDFGTITIRKFIPQPSEPAF